VATAQHNVGASDETIDDRSVVALDEATDDQSVVASDQEIGEQNGALSQLKHKDNIGINCFKICGH
jgi:hypothetical protein